MYVKITDDVLRKPMYDDVELGSLSLYLDSTDTFLCSIADFLVRSLNGHDMRITYELSDNSLIYDIGCLPDYDRENIKAWLRLHRVGKDPAVAHNADLILSLIDQYERGWETDYMSEFYLECLIWDTLQPPPYHGEWEQRWHAPYLFQYDFDELSNPNCTNELPF